MVVIRTISIEGNIAAGKSSIIEGIAKKFKETTLVKCFPEPLSVWQQVPYVFQPGGFNLFKKLYENPSKYAFAFQLYALLTMYQRTVDALEEAGRLNESARCCLLVFERSFVTTQLFCQIQYDLNNLDSHEYGIYGNYVQMLLEKEPRLVPDQMIYLDVDPELAMSRMEQRKRPEEKHVSLEYLKIIDRAHRRHLKDVVSVSANGFKDGVSPDADRASSSTTDCHAQVNTHRR